jgi:hypothetical protein
MACSTMPAGNAEAVVARRPRRICVVEKVMLGRCWRWLGLMSAETMSYLEGILIHRRAQHLPIVHIDLFWSFW